jgi:hypothetical protein
MGTTFEGSLRVSHQTRAIASMRHAKTGINQQALANRESRTQATNTQSSHISIDEQDKQDGRSRFHGIAQQGMLFDVQTTTHSNDSDVPRSSTRGLRPSFD